MPSIVGAGRVIRWPNNEVRYAGQDLVVTARTSVRLRRVGARDGTDDELFTGPLFGALSAWQ
jgi:hypothetical protein